MAPSLERSVVGTRYGIPTGNHFGAPRFGCKGRAVDRDRWDRYIADMMAKTIETLPILIAPDPAPQVGVGLRLTIVDLMPDDRSNPITLINPEVVARSEKLATREEGCLSLPGQYADVTRPAWVTVRYTDANGAKRQIEAEGLLAACVLHEIDHLDGVLFIDHLSALKRNMILRRLAKELRQKRAEAM
jgi:peptide deformylase